MAVPSLRGAAGTAVFGTSGTITPTNPTHQAGDLLVMIVGSSANGSTTPTHSTPSGWSAGPTAENTSGTTRAKVSAFYKTATSAAEGNPSSTVTPTGASNAHHSAVVLVVQNASTLATPIEGSSNAQTAGASAQAVTLTTSGVNRFGIVAAMHSDNVATGATTATQTYTQDIATDDATGIDGFLYVGHRNATNGSGNGTTVTFTSGGTSVGVAGIAFAVKPIDGITAAPGSVAVTGTAATLKYGRVFTASAGSMAVTGTAATFWYGRVSTAIRFATDHDGLYTTSIASHNPNEQTWLVFIRYRVTRVGSGVQMCAMSMEANNGTAHYFLCPETTFNANTVESHDSFSGGGFIVGTAVLAAGDWWVVAESNSLSNSRTTLYTQKVATNGALLAETNNDHGNFTDMTRLIVGTDDAQPITNSPQNEWLDGDIAGIKLWDHELTATELESEKRSLPPVKTSGCKEWWKPDSGGTLVPQLGNFGAFSNIAGTFGFPSGTNGRTFRTDGPPLAGVATGYLLTASSGSVSITGTAANFGVKMPADSGSYSLTGTAANFALKMPGDAGSVALSGTAAGLRVGRNPLAAAAGAVTISGAAASLVKAYPLAAAAGSVALAGTAATLLEARRLSASAGATAITGTAASPLVGHRVTASSGAETISGTAAALLRGYPLAAAAGSVSISGGAAALLRGAKVGAAAGSVAIGGTAAALKAGRLVSAGAGSVTWTGTAATLVYIPTGGGAAYTLTASSGQESVTGTAAALKFGRLVGAAAGSVSVSGAAAGLRTARQLGGAGGAWSISGTAAATKAGRLVAAGAGAMDITGPSTALASSRATPSFYWTAVQAFAATSASTAVAGASSASVGSRNTGGQSTAANRNTSFTIEEN